jgi:hypothetical protein
MERHSRRSALLHLAAVALLFLGYGLELLDKLLDLMATQLPPIHGTAHVTLDDLTAGPYTLIAEPAHFTWTGRDVDLRVGGASV